jgi:hypothetical protein
MKSLLIIFSLAFSTQFLIAQDVCAELMKFSSYEKNINRSMRMTSKASMANQIQIMERDKEGNMYQIIKMEMGTQKVRMETITLGSTMYTNQNAKEWIKRELDSAQLNSMKNQWKNNQLQYYKNCEKKNNDTIDGKIYRVYNAELDINQMQENIKNSKSMSDEEKQGMEQAMSAMSNMQMSMTLFVNDKDDVERSKTRMSIQGQEIESNVTYEYDVKVTVSPPPMNVNITVPTPTTTPPPPAPVKQKN